MKSPAIVCGKRLTLALLTVSTLIVSGCYDTDSDGFRGKSDCDDNNAEINPDATEICDGIDNDCDGEIDEGLAQTWYLDEDLDGFGGTTVNDTACAQPDGFVSQGGDCDDSDPAINPEAGETCDGIDNNCDGEIDEGLAQVWYFDADSDGYGGETINNTACAQPEGYTSLSGDCDDADPAVYPGAEDVCDGIDNDCDDDIDEDGVTTLYSDVDSDGYGAADSASTACPGTPGLADNALDCDDADGDIHPGATEVPDNDVDENCDGLDRTVNLYVMQDGVNPYSDSPVVTSIQEAVDTAFSGQTIAVGPGTYEEKIDFSGKNLYLVSMFGPEETIIDGGGTTHGADGVDSVFVFVHSEGLTGDAVVQGFTIRGGRGSDGTVCGYSLGELTGLHYGGAVCTRGTAPTLIGNIIEDNSVDGSGGALYLDEGPANLYDNVIRNNFAEYDSGGINLSQSSGEIIGNVIIDNEAGRYGGGLFAYQSEGLIANNVIAFNSVTNSKPTSGGGAGVCLHDSYPTVVNNVIAYNTANPIGGGVRIFNVDDGGDFVNNTVVGNGATEEGGGIHVAAGTMTFTNNIVAFNQATTGANALVDSGGGLATSFNIYYSTTTGSDVVGVTLNDTDMVVDPGLVNDPTDFVVEDDDYRLQDDSPAVDAGSPDAARNDPDGSRNDIGAYGGPRGADFTYYTMAEITALRTD